MLWSAFTLSFYEFLHASECLSLTRSNVILTDTHILIELHQSKINPFQREQFIHIYPTTSCTCPVHDLRLFANRIKVKLLKLHVFNAEKFSPLSHPKPTQTICHLLSQVGMCSSSYATHSFRIGAATTAGAAGLPTWLIKTLGRWSSNAYLTYVRCPSSEIASVIRTLSSATVTGYPTWNPDN